MPAIPFENEFGYLTFEFERPPEAAPDAVVHPPVRVDVYETHKAYSALVTDLKDDPDPHAVGFAWREKLYALGFPPMSVANGYQVVRQVVAEMDRLGKADAGSGSAG